MKRLVLLFLLFALLLLVGCGSSTQEKATTEKQTTTYRQEKRDTARSVPQTTAATTAAPLYDYDYVANKNTKKFHFPDCSSVDDMKDKNKWYFTGSRWDLIELGYDPCKRCNP